MAETFLYILSIILKVAVVPVVVLIYKKKLTFLQGLFTATLLFTASFVCEIFSINIAGNYSYIDSIINNSFDEIKNTYSVENGLTAQQAADVSRNVEYVRNLYFALLPSIVLIIQLVGAYFWLMVSKGILALCKKDVSGFWRFCDFRMPKGSIWMGVLCLCAYLVMADSRISLALLNITVILVFATFVCGISIIDFKLRIKIKNSFLRFLLYIAVSGFVLGFGMCAILIAGMIDAFFNLRVPRKKPDDLDEE